MTESELSPAMVKAIETIQKLLNLAARGGTPEEAANAAAKAQDLLNKYNLSVDTVTGATQDGKREEAKVAGQARNKGFATSHNRTCDLHPSFLDNN